MLGLDGGGGEESLGEGKGDEGFVDGVAAGGESTTRLSCVKYRLVYG